ncbi:MAG TPA: Hsp20/alpha crystallin family protein [Burkholderiaceae bacterium]|nr:Hsp20/alpha crystallin family protein [Burkholderiaceae bacterium]
MYQLSTRRGESFNSLVDELFSDFFHRANVPAARHSNTPAVSRARMDVLDKGGNFEVKVDLPGIRKDDIHVGIEGARVSINAESKDSSETKNGDKVLYSERYSTSYARSFELPADVTEEGADARFEDGVLTLSLPKRAPTVSKRLAVK